MNRLLKLAYEFLKLSERQINVVEGNFILSRSIRSTFLGKSIKYELRDVLNYLERYILNDKKYPSISLTDPSKIRFFQHYPKDIDLKEVSVDDPGRALTTLGRYIKRDFYKSLSKSNKEIFDKYISDKVLDLYIKEINTEIMDYLGDIDRKVEEKYDVKKEYEETEASSCMSGGDCKKMEILSKNPDKVSLVTIGDGEARALLWTDDEGNKILDRAYPSGSKYVLPLRRWAEKKGYILRENPDGVVVDGLTVELSDGKQHIITLDMSNMDQDIYPYLDTFRFGEIRGDDLLLSNYRTFGDLVFTKDDGEYEQKALCAECGEMVNNSGFYNEKKEPICEECYQNNFLSCDNCSDPISLDNVNEFEGEFYCNHCYHKMVNECSECGKQIGEDDSFYDEDGSPYCRDCADLKQRCEKCGTPISIPYTEYDEEGNENMYCEDCFEPKDECKECGNSLDYKTVGGRCLQCVEDIAIKDELKKNSK